ncbi:MAG: PDR/VanB family oxidoreductase [Mycobacterium sp.]
MSSTLELIVTESETLADGVLGLTFENADGGELPEWDPGAHLDLMLTDTLVRQYSLCSDPRDRKQWKIGVLLHADGRGGSSFVHRQLHVGSTVRARGPRNLFPLQPAGHYQFIAGGIGITPIIAMITAADKQGSDWRLLYGGRRRSSMAFLDRLESYGNKVTVWPEDECGLLDLGSVLGSPRDGTLVYSCGPEGMLTAVERACGSWPAGTLHTERFTADPPAPDPNATTFDVVCDRSGITVTISPDDSILEVLRAKGVNVLSSCMSGICGTCETPVLEGEPDHRDSVLDDDDRAAGDCMMICVSRSRSPQLVLDI